MPVAKSTKPAAKATTATKVARTKSAAAKPKNEPAKALAAKDVAKKSLKAEPQADSVKLPKAKRIKAVEDILAVLDEPAEEKKRPSAEEKKRPIVEEKKRPSAEEKKRVIAAEGTENAAKKTKPAEEVKEEVPVAVAKPKGSSKKVVSKANSTPKTAEKATSVDTSVKPTREQVQMACEALLQHVSAYKKASQARKLALPGVSKEDQVVFVQITLRRMPEQAVKTFKGRPIPLPHPFHDLENTTVCAFVKDKVEAKKWLGDDYQKHGIKKIVSLQQLRTAYKSFEAKRELADQYDVFVADDRIVCMLPKALGKVFYVGSKRPLPIRMAKLDKLAPGVTTKINKALGSAFFYLSGVSTSIRVGTSAQSADELVDNIGAVIQGAVEHIPGKWKGVQSIFIKSEKSASLPVYEAPVADLQKESSGQAA
jgi:ribosome biogenesis protein UTP30